MRPPTTLFFASSMSSEVVCFWGQQSQACLVPGVHLPTRPTTVITKSCWHGAIPSGFNIHYVELHFLLRAASRGAQHVVAFGLWCASCVAMPATLQRSGSMLARQKIQWHRPQPTPATHVPARAGYLWYLFEGLCLARAVANMSAAEQVSVHFLFMFVGAPVSGNYVSWIGHSREDPGTATRDPLFSQVCTADARVKA